MAIWNSIVAPDYVPPSTSSASWVWSIVGWGWNVLNNCNAVIIRLDYVKLDANGNFVRQNNFRPGYLSGNPTCYRPIFLSLNEGTLGDGGGSHMPGYDYWASQGANVFWKNYIYKYLYGMRNIASMVAYFPL